MAEINTWKDAEARALEVLATDENKPVVFPEPLEVDGKLFWAIGYLKKDSDQDARIDLLLGSNEYVADNGKILSISSSPGMDQMQLLIEEYQKQI